MDTDFPTETVVQVGNHYAINKQFRLYGKAYEDISKMYGLSVTPTVIDDVYHVCGTLTKRGYTRFWTYLRLGYAEYKHAHSKKQRAFSIKAELRKIELRKQELEQELQTLM